MLLEVSKGSPFLVLLLCFCLLTVLDSVVFIFLLGTDSGDL